MTEMIVLAKRSCIDLEFLGKGFCKVHDAHVQRNFLLKRNQIKVLFPTKQKSFTQMKKIYYM